MEALTAALAAVLERPVTSIIGGIALVFITAYILMIIEQTIKWVVIKGRAIWRWLTTKQSWK